MEDFTRLEERDNEFTGWSGGGIDFSEERRKDRGFSPLDSSR